MESQEPKPKKDIGLTTIELEIPETYIDDDNFFSKSISWKRRLKIVEKVLTIFMAIIAIPLSAYIASWIDIAQGGMVAAPLRFNPFSKELWSITILPYILSFIILIACEFFFKNISLTKGVLKTTCYSLILSVLINVTTFTLCTAFRQAIINSESNLYYAYIAMGAIDGCVYTFILLIIRIILKVINKSNKKRVIIVGPKEDAQILSKKMIKENKKQCTIRYVFYEIDGQISEDIYTKVKKVNTIILLDSLTAKNKQSSHRNFVDPAQIGHADGDPHDNQRTDDKAPDPAANRKNAADGQCTVIDHDGRPADELQNVQERKQQAALLAEAHFYGLHSAAARAPADEARQQHHGAADDMPEQNGRKALCHTQRRKGGAGQDLGQRDARAEPDQAVLKGRGLFHSTKSPFSANMWFIGPEPRPRSSIAASAPEMYAFARSTDVSRS